MHWVAKGGWRIPYAFAFTYIAPFLLLTKYLGLSSLYNCAALAAWFLWTLGTTVSAFFLSSSHECHVWCSRGRNDFDMKQTWLALKTEQTCVTYSSHQRRMKRRANSRGTSQPGKNPSTEAFHTLGAVAPSSLCGQCAYMTVTLGRQEFCQICLFFCVKWQIKQSLLVRLGLPFVWEDSWRAVWQGSVITGVSKSSSLVLSKRRGRCYVDTVFEFCEIWCNSYS